MPSKSTHLAAPLTKFDIPIVSWYPDNKQFEKFKKCRVSYFAPDKTKIKGKEWYEIIAFNPQNQQLGMVYLPLKYYSLWRRLVYRVVFQEKMFEAWIEKTKAWKKKGLNAVQEEAINLKNMTGVRLVQYLLYRRLVLEELMKLQFEKHEPVVHSLIEFGIREFRDWLFESFQSAKKEDPIYLCLDPTNPKNNNLFGAHSGS
jgi:hypothetical protein